MKKITFILFLFWSISGFSQRKEVIVKTEFFTINYSEVYRQPLSVKYQVLCPNGTASRKGMNFFTNDSIITSRDRDYLNNVYDKGHMAPAASFSCNTQMMKETFSYLNCALQEQSLNRGVWKFLEIYERELALKNSKTEVEILVEFNNPKKLASGATVPSGFYKKITTNEKVFMYYFPNEKPKYQKYQKYEIEEWPKIN
jgi:endonuclease G